MCKWFMSNKVSGQFSNESAIQATRGVLEFENVDITPACPFFIDTEDSVNEGIKHIELRLPLFSTSVGAAFRVPPLVLSRLSRGGKTVLLHLLFKRLKELNYAPVYISFNGGFERIPGETDGDAILRLIAIQFISPLGQEAENHYFKFDAAQVLDCLTTTANGRPVVLLIDELNSLAKPLDNFAAELLRREFLDKKGRYLVFSTHIPMDLDTTIDKLLGKVSIKSSPRGYIPLNMPFSKNASAYRQMFDDESIVPTPLQVALFGGIPSLLYSTMKGSQPPDMRVSTDLSQNPVESADKEQTCNEFVQEFFSGIRANKLVRRFDKYSTIDKYDHSNWALCFVLPILRKLSSKSLASSISKLVDNELPVYSSRTQTGLDWETIVHVAILLRCFCFPAWIELPLFASAKVYVEDARSVVLPNDCATLDDANTFIKKYFETATVGTVVFFTPQFARFPDYDGILAYKAAEESIRVAGTQVKSKNKYPKNKVPDWMESAHLIRGDAPQSSGGKGKWRYMSKEEMLKLLGNSLAPLYPSSWPE